MNGTTDSSGSKAMKRHGVGVVAALVIAVFSGSASAQVLLPLFDQLRDTRGRVALASASQSSIVPTATVMMAVT